ADCDTGYNGRHSNINGFDCRNNYNRSLNWCRWSWRVNLTRTRSRSRYSLNFTRCDSRCIAGDCFGFYFAHVRSEEHTSELQSRFDLVCRLLLEKKNIITYKE